MAGTIYSGSYLSGIVLDDPATQRPATVTGSVSNQNGDAIYGKPIARWTVANSGTIQSTGSTGYGIDLAARGTVENGVSGATTALIAGYGGVLIRGALATVSNLGTISGTGTKHDGVELKAGGQVSNGSAASSKAVIKGNGDGINVAGAAATISNYGAIDGVSGVVLNVGGSVANEGGGQISATVGDGVSISGASGTVTNFGTIAANYGSKDDLPLSINHYGVVLQAGGTVINGSPDSTSALISGSGIVENYYSGLGGATYTQIFYVTGAVSIQGNSGRVTNFGTIISDRNGVGLYAGGTVTNGSAVSTKALIHGEYSGVKISLRGAVTNFGTIVSQRTEGIGYVSSSHFGVSLETGGSVTNGSSNSTTALIEGTAIGASIAGNVSIGVSIAGGAGTVMNFGTIEGVGTSGQSIKLAGKAIELAAGGTVVNFGTITGTGVPPPSSAYQFGRGVYIDGGAGTVTNFGTIDADIGVDLKAGGRVTNGSTAATRALIDGGVYISGGGTVTNYGTVSAGIGDQGVEIAGHADGKLINFGTISSVYVIGGGRVINGSAASTRALISRGVRITGAAGTVTNFGTTGYVDVLGGSVTNGSAASTRALITVGVLVTGGAGTVTNFGRIRRDQSSPGVELVAGGTVTNLGTISSNQIGVELASGGRITNGSAASSGALINGADEGVYIAGGSPGTVTNFGTISGSSGVAVRIAAGDAGRLVVEPGAMFVDSVLGGGVSRIDFETAGVADMRDVSGFDRITLGDGKSHSLTLTDANFAAVRRTVITVDDGDSGNTLTAVSLPAADRIIVHAGRGLDNLTGGAGNDVFFAGGDTMMTGGAGKNEFIFSAPGNNTVGDFAVSATNEVVFSDKGFSLGLSGASGTPQALPTGLFVENSDGHFTGTGQRFAYATGSRDLFYSTSGRSGTPALVSHFAGYPSLAATQLFFIT